LLRMRRIWGAGGVLKRLRNKEARHRGLTFREWFSRSLTRARDRGELKRCCSENPNKTINKKEGGANEQKQSIRRRGKSAAKGLSEQTGSAFLE